MSVGWAERLAVACVLALAFALLHHSALGVGWTFDDPAHLHFAATYSPWEYFTQREVMLRQSYAHITPWNVLFYDLGMPWAGLDARRHHVHLLAVLWVTAVATWALLRRWLGPAAALAGALLFVAMPATAIVGRMLMTGHYAYGLLFCVLALHAWVRALAAPAETTVRSAVLHAGLAAFFYALACLCKELYAPLPAVLLCMPASAVSMRRRLALMLPVVAVAGGYACLRLWLFGGSGVGGHAMLALGQPPVADIPGMLEQFRVLLWGMGKVGWGALVLSSLIAVLALLGRHEGGRRGVKPALLLLAGCGLALVLPLASLARAGELGYGHHRLVFVLAWALAVALAWQLQRAGRMGWVLAPCLVALLVVSQQRAATFVDDHSRPLARHYDFLLAGAQGGPLIPSSYERVGYLKALADTLHLRTGRPAPVVVGDDGQIAALGAEAGARAQTWVAECRCFRSLGAEGYERRVQTYRDQLDRARGRPLQLEVQLQAVGARKALRWKLQGQPDAARIWFEVPDIGRLNIGQEGQFSFGVDNTLPVPDPMVLRFGVETPDGALILTPFMKLPLSGTHTLRWQTDGLDPAAGAVAMSAN